MAEKITDFENKIELAFPKAEQKKGADMIGETIVIKDYKEIMGDNGKYLVLLADWSGKEVSFSCGSQVVMKQVIKAKTDGTLPIRAIFTRVKNKEKSFSYYTLLPPDKN